MEKSTLMELPLALMLTILAMMVITSVDLVAACVRQMENGLGVNPNVKVSLNDSWML